MTNCEKMKMDEIILKVKAGNAMILCTPDGVQILPLKPGKKLSFVDMMTILATMKMTYSGETLTFHPVHGTCYRVENSKGEPLAVVHQGIWDSCGDFGAA